MNSLLTLDLCIEYNDVKTAEAVYNSIKLDSEGYISTELQDNIIQMKMEASNAGTMRNTMNDLLACVKVAEEASGLVTNATTNLDANSLFE